MQRLDKIKKKVEDDPSKWIYLEEYDYKRKKRTTERTKNGTHERNISKSPGIRSTKRSEKLEISVFWIAYIFHPTFSGSCEEDLTTIINGVDIMINMGKVRDNQKLQ